MQRNPLKFGGKKYALKTLSKMSKKQQQQKIIFKSRSDWSCGSNGFGRFDTLNLIARKKITANVVLQAVSGE